MLGTIEIVSKLLQVLLGGPFFDEGILSYASLWPQMMFSSVAEAGKFMLPGLLILISQKGLVQLIVPFPKSECPRCDYALAKLKQPRCPECGLKLSAEFLQEEDDSDA
ncbi:MAG: hypothetical protein O7G85_17745 [Planctomycetota bacterium]|nr:hypothetical protein [Planctomycetota bacterium]